MNNMEINKLRKQSENALKKNLEEARSHLRELRFKVSANQLKGVREIRETRQAIAQILTILKEKTTQK